MENSDANQFPEVDLCLIDPPMMLTNEKERSMHDCLENTSLELKSLNGSIYEASLNGFVSVEAFPVQLLRRMAMMLLGNCAHL